MKSYNLEYWIGTKHVSTISYNKPKVILKGIAKMLKTNQSYKLGLFKYKLN